MYLAFHYPFFGSATVDAHAINCLHCGANDWQDRDITTCNPGDTFTCNRCGSTVYVNWGIDEPDHLSNWISSEHCPHRLCKLKYAELRVVMGWDDKTVETCRDMFQNIREFSKEPIPPPDDIC